MGLEGKYENVDGQASEQLVYSRLWLQKLVFNTDYLLMQVKNIAECFLQYFRPSLSYHFPLRPLFYLFLSGRLRHFYCTIAHLWVFIRLRSAKTNQSSPNYGVCTVQVVFIAIYFSVMLSIDISTHDLYLFLIEHLIMYA